MPNTIVKLRNVRLSFPQLWQARAVQQGGKARFGASLLLHKVRNAAEIKALNAAIADLLKEKKWPAGTVKSLCLTEAVDKISTKTGEPYDGYDKDHMVVSANADSKPMVVDRSGADLSAEDGKPYAGCYVNANIDVYAYDKVKEHGRRICASLRSVQFWDDGEPFSGGGPLDATAEFGDVTADDKSLL